MPNGGVPFNMFLHPLNNPGVVLHCRGSELMIFDKEVFDKHGDSATPIVSFTKSEANAIAWFLEYWLEYPNGKSSLCPSYDIKGINVDFAF